MTLHGHSTITMHMQYLDRSHNNRIWFSHNCSLSTSCFPQFIQNWLRNLFPASKHHHLPPKNSSTILTFSQLCHLGHNLGLEFCQDALSPLAFLLVLHCPEDAPHFGDAVGWPHEVISLLLQIRQLWTVVMLEGVKEKPRWASSLL